MGHFELFSSLFYLKFVLLDSLCYFVLLVVPLLVVALFDLLDTIQNVLLQKVLGLQDQGIAAVVETTCTNHQLVRYTTVS